jgi:hypothetical protein
MGEERYTHKGNTPQQRTGRAEREADETTVEGPFLEKGFWGLISENTQI